MSNYEIDFWRWIHIPHFKYVWNLPKCHWLGFSSFIFNFRQCDIRSNSEWLKLHFHICPNIEAECYNFLKLLSICCICIFNLILANPFLTIDFLIHKDPVLFKGQKISIKNCRAVTSSKNEWTNLFFYPDSPEILETYYDSTILFRDLLTFRNFREFNPSS